MSEELEQRKRDREEVIEPVNNHSDVNNFGYVCNLSSGLPGFDATFLSEENVDFSGNDRKFIEHPTREQKNFEVNLENLSVGNLIEITEAEDKAEDEEAEDAAEGITNQVKDKSMCESCDKLRHIMARTNNNGNETDWQELIDYLRNVDKLTDNFNRCESECETQSSEEQNYSDADSKSSIGSDSDGSESEGLFSKIFNWLKTFIYIS
jgi:hypothetical protein